VDEAQVQHLVYFVKHEHFDIGESKRTALDEIDETARCCDDDINAAAQDINLLADGDTAKNHRTGDFQIAAIGLEAFADSAKRVRGLARAREPCRSSSLRAQLTARGAPKSEARRQRLAGAGLGYPKRSRPFKSSGMARAWMGVGLS
jgi:hypothetical protein